MAPNPAGLEGVPSLEPSQFRNNQQQQHPPPDRYRLLLVQIDASHREICFEVCALCDISVALPLGCMTVHHARVG